MMKSCRHRICYENEGVAAVVGTIMSLMVVLAFLTIFTTQWVPIWIAENEATHMTELMAQFGTLKQNIDNLILMNDNTLIAYTSFTLVAPGIPVFAEETQGQLDARIGTNTFPRSGKCYVAAVLGDGYGFGTDGSNKIRDDNYSDGQIRVYMPNKQYVQQKIAYENGAIILWQPDGMHVKASPQFDLLPQLDPSESDGLAALNVTFKLIALYGRNTASAERTDGVHTQLYYTQKQAFTLYKDWFTKPITIWINITSDYVKAWYSFFNDTLTKKGLTYDPSPPTSPWPVGKNYRVYYTRNNQYVPLAQAKTMPQDRLSELTVTIRGVTAFHLDRANVRAVIGSLSA